MDKFCIKFQKTNKQTQAGAYDMLLLGKYKNIETLFMFVVSFTQSKLKLMVAV